MTELHARISRLLAGALNIDIPSVDMDLFETGVLDSLAFVELLLQLEREFGVVTSVADLEVENFRTIARIAEFVAGRAGAAVQNLKAVGALAEPPLARNVAG
jgi:D-alanine--poly(phosphoribitol) ligase subunit 2